MTYTGQHAGEDICTTLCSPTATFPLQEMRVGCQILSNFTPHKLVGFSSGMSGFCSAPRRIWVYELQNVTVACFTRTFIRDLGWSICISLLKKKIWRCKHLGQPCFLPCKDWPNFLLKKKKKSPHELGSTNPTEHFDIISRPPWSMS